MKNIIFVLLSLAASLSGQGVPFGLHFPLTSEYDTDKLNPHIANDVDGNFLLCWESWDHNYGANFGIHGQLFSSDGEKKGNGFVLNPFADYREQFPVLIALHNGYFWVAWTNMNAEQIAGGAYAQLVSSTGELVGTPFSLSADSKYQEYLAMCTQLASGDIAACKISMVTDSSAWQIGVRLFVPNGEPKGVEITINMQPEEGQSRCDLIPENLIPLPGGGFVLFWQCFEESFSRSKLYGQRFDRDGRKTGEAFRVNSEEDGRLSQVGFIQSVILPQGKFILCWESHAETGSEAAFYARRFDQEGGMMGDLITITSSLEWPEAMWLESLTSAALLVDGSFVVTWLVMENWGYECYGQIYSEEGIPKGGRFKFEQRSSIQNMFGPTLLPFTGGGFMGYWLGRDRDGNTELYGQLFAGNGEKIGPDFRISEGTVGSTMQTFSARLDTESYLLVWPEVSDKGYYAKRFPEAPFHHALSGFQLLAPQNNASTMAVNPVLVWEQPGEFVVCYPFEMHYTIYLDEDPGFLSPTIWHVDKDTTFRTESLPPGSTYFWKVLAKNLDGDSLWSTNTNALYIQADTTAVEQHQNGLPDQFVLHHNFPNPFNLETSIRFELSEPGIVHLAVFDIQGRLITTLLNEKKLAGSHTVRWDGRDAGNKPRPSGIYICKMEVQTFSGERYARALKMGLIK